jgi:hypothetical protein
MIEAILTVLTDITRAGFEATGINTEDMVSIDDIAARTGRSRESVRLLSLGKRGPGGFPSPMSPDGGQAFYSWTMVRRWFADHYGEESVAPADEDAATLAAADLILRARLLTPRVSELRNLIPA